MNNLNINEISVRAEEKEPFYVHGYKVSVFDVTEQTVKEHKEATGEDVFEADCTHTQYEICFVDECGVNRGLVQVGFENNIINEQLGQDDLMISAGFADADGE